jgi:hypothetical protein
MRRYCWLNHLVFSGSNLAPPLWTRVKVEQAGQLFHAHDLLVSAGVPAQQGEHVDEGFRVVALFAVTTALLSGVGVRPIQGEHREAEPVAVALAELSVAVGFQDQRQVGELPGAPNRNAS